MVHAARENTLGGIRMATRAELKQEAESMGLRIITSMTKKDIQKEINRSKSFKRLAKQMAERKSSIPWVLK